MDKQPVRDDPIDASSNAEYIEHCADRLERCGLPVTASALRAIAHVHRALAEQAAANAERAFFAQDFYEEAREGKKPWPGQQAAAERVDVRKLVALAEQWERDAAGCRRDGYIDAAVVKEDCAYRIRQTLGISAIAEAVEVDAPGSRAWMAEVCRAAALSLAAHGVRNDQLSKVADWIAQQPAADLRSTHRVWRGDNWQPCYCEATDDHRIGSEQAEAAHEPCAAVAAIQFALTDPEGMTFLRLWNEGEFDTLRREWPDALRKIYNGADPLAQQRGKVT